MIWDTIFIIPFFSGLLVAISLSAIGVLLYLRNEWLAALGFAHLAGASATIGLMFHIPTVIGAIFGAVVGAVIKTITYFHGNTVYALMILAGWSITLLVAANTVLSSIIGHIIVEGQLYFADSSHLKAAIILAFTVLAGLYWLMPILIKNTFFPNNYATKRWYWGIAFNLLTALSMAVATATVGLMSAFALIFIPPWLAFRLSRNWKQTIVISISFGMVGYSTSFLLALFMDQPFAPVLVALFLVSVALLTFLKKSN